MTGMPVKYEVSEEEFMYHLTDAAYRCVLKHGITAPFIDVELGILEAIRKVLQEETILADTSEVAEGLRPEGKFRILVRSKSGGLNWIDKDRPRI